MAHHHGKNHAGAGATRALSDNPIIRTSRLKCNDHGVWYVHYSEPDGAGGIRSKRFSTQTQDAAAAQEALDEWLRAASEDATTTRRQRYVTVADMLDLYSEAKRLRPTDQTSYTIRPLRTLLGGLAPADINRQVVENYQRLRRHPRSGDALSSSTLRRELGTLIAVLNHGVRERCLAAADVPVIALPPESAPRDRSMTEDEETAFWRAAQAEGGALALFVAIGLETAARKGAIIGLTWERVDLPRRLIDFRDPKRPANRKQRVVVKISNRLLPVLEQAQQPTGRLFDVSLRKRYEAFTQRLGMPWVTPHVMRHTWASLAAQSGAPMLKIAKVLGDQQRTVERTYAHLTPDHMDDVINRRWKAAA